MIKKEFIALENGETIAYLEAGIGNKTIIAIHGNYNSSYKMMPFLTHLPNDYRIILPDLRGFGDSSYNKSITTLKELSDDLILMCKQMGIKEAIIVGHSLGGGVAMQFAIDAPDITQKLILIAPTSVFGYPLFAKDKDGNPAPYDGIEGLKKDPLFTPAVEAIKNKNKDVMGAIVVSSMSRHLPSKEYCDLCIEEALKQKDLLAADWALIEYNITDKPSLYKMGSNQAKDIKCPIFLASATEDTMVLPFMTQQNLDAFKNCNLTHIEYSDCGHMIHFDQEEKFFKDYLEFLRK